jgi:putative Mn2+ efflux pump MntP
MPSFDPAKPGQDPFDMTLATILGIALALAMDAFSVAVAVGISLDRITPGHQFRRAFHFGLFQFLMPVIGWGLGRVAFDLVAPLDHWIIFVLLAGIGTRMIIESRKKERAPSATDLTRGRHLVFLSVATSLDALAVGIGLGLLGGTVVYPAVIIGLVAGAMTELGLHLGHHVGRLLGRVAETAGGIILWVIGLKILAEHLGLPL